MSSDYLSVREVAKRLGKEPASIRKLITARELKAVNLGSSKQVRMRIRPEWVAEFEQSRLVKEPAPPAPRRRKFAKPPVEYI